MEACPSLCWVPPPGLPDPEKSLLEGRFQAWGDLWRGIQAPVSVGGNSGSSGAPDWAIPYVCHQHPRACPSLGQALAGWGVDGEGGVQLWNMAVPGKGPAL